MTTIFVFAVQETLVSEVNTEQRMEITEPAGEMYSEITWYKGSRDHSIVRLRKDKNFLVYEKEFCMEGQHICHNSTKGSLDELTGTLTIFNTEPSDEGFYYYSFYPRTHSGSYDTGYNYEIFLQVPGESVCPSSYTHGGHFRTAIETE